MAIADIKKFIDDNTKGIADGNIINAIVNCLTEDKNNKEWTFGRYEKRQQDNFYNVRGSCVETH